MQLTVIRESSIRTMLVISQKEEIMGNSYKPLQLRLSYLKADDLRWRIGLVPESL